MKGLRSLLNRTRSRDVIIQYDLTNAAPDSPEANAPRAIQLFCESNSDSNGGGGEEVLHLPVIVEAAESSPAAAAACAQQIRKFLSKDWAQKPHVQYNAIMLTRILSDNPGHTFTRNFDQAFVKTVKELLIKCKDQSTQQILRETLDNLEVNKQHDEDLQALLHMWRKEKGQMASLDTSGSRRVPRQPHQQRPQSHYAAGAWQQAQPHPGAVHVNGGLQQPHGGRTSGRCQLPPPAELASRIEEARNTAKMLMQLIQSAPAEEVLANELIKEFSERCQSAQKGMQQYINCDNPAPDDDTLQTLIETNEQLSLAGSRYQRAVLAARRAIGTSANGSPLLNGDGVYSPLPGSRIYAPQSVQGGSLFAPDDPPSKDSYADGTSLFAQPQPQRSTHGHEGYVPPPGPPRSLMSSFQQRDTQQQQSYSPPPQLPQSARRDPVTVSGSDPFADPVEHTSNPTPLTVEPTNSGSSDSLPPQIQPTNHRQAPSQRFSKNAGPSYKYDDLYNSGYDTHHTSKTLDSSYRAADSPLVSAQTQSEAATHTPDLAISPISSNYSPEEQLARPSPVPWHNSGITPSYTGRQSSAAQNFTTHGAQGEEEVQETYSHPDVRRKEHDPAGCRTDDI